MKLTSKVLSLALAGIMITSAAAMPTYAASVPKVKNVKVTSTDDDEINLKWSKVNGASGYQVYIKAENGKWKLAETAKKTKAEVDDLQDATTYSVKVRAYKNTKSGKKYGSYSKAVKASTAPDEVEALSLKKASSEKVKLSWNTVSGADGYAVYKYNSSTGKWKRIAKTTGTSKTVSVSASGGEKFRIKAYTLLNEKYYYGDASDSVKYVTENSSSDSITAAEAKKIALADAGVSKAYDYDIEKDKENGKLVYEIDFLNGGFEYEYVINASNGNIIHKEKERNN